MRAGGNIPSVRGVFVLARSLLASLLQLNASSEDRTMTLNTAGIHALSSGGAVPGNDNSKTKTGTFDNAIHGEGTFSKTMQEVNGEKTVDKTITFANGKTRSVEKTIVTNDDGSKTVTRTGKNGKTSTTTETATANADGTFTISKEKTLADGSVVEISGTKSSMNGETDMHVVRTNADGQTETLDRQMIKDGHTKTYTTTGTGYDGNPIYKESSWTTMA
jgi:hypothetical protein